MKQIGLVFSLCGLLIGCAQSPVTTTTTEIKDGPPLQAIDIRTIPDIVPRPEARSRYGNPDTYTVWGQNYRVMPSNRGYVQQGIASWYGSKFHGNKTSNGETYDMLAMTAAHRSLPIPTYVRVTNLSNQRSTIVRVNDRGPFHPDRIIDLSYAAAAKLGIDKTGTAPVKLEALQASAASPSRIPLKTEPSARQPVYFQLGAFSHYKNAVQLHKRLTLLPNARIQKHRTPETTLYLVRVGPVTSRDRFKQLQQQLATLGISNYRIIAEPLNSLSLVLQ